MAPFVIVGAALTLVSLGLLFLGGYLLAIRLLPGSGGDPLAIAIATLLGATAQAIAVALALGAAGRLFLLPWALLLQLLLILALLRWPRRLSSAELRGPLRLLAGRVWARLREHPALAIITLSALASEALRGLLRPPLAWDGVMDQLLLAASWLQSGHLRPVFGTYPLSFLGYAPANGSLWLWWWMAPSHSELYVNLAFLPHCLLLGLAAGGIARQLGGRRHWPLAGFLILLTPVVTRSAATQHVDLFLAATLLAAGFFGLLWMREPRSRSAALAGAGLGLAAGSMASGLLYAALLGGALLLLAPGWRGGGGREEEVLGETGESLDGGGDGSGTVAGGKLLRQALLALALALVLGGYFYLRNVALGAGPIAAACARQGVAAASTTTAATPAWSGALELGIGPPALLLLLLFILMPFALPPARRREGWVAAIQVGGELAIWAAAPFASLQEPAGDVRQLIPAIALLFATGVAIAESRAISAVAVEALALLLAAQGLVQLHTEMSSGVRVAMATIDVALVALALVPALRRFLRRRAAAVVAAVLVALIAGAVPLARFRIADRGRALAEERPGHAGGGAGQLARGWAWLDSHGGEGAVAVAAAPGPFCVYPAMGPYLARRVHIVNVNRADRDSAAGYRGCEPRVDPSPEAWLANLRRARVRWLLVERSPEVPFPIEQRWADAAPGLFVLRYGDGASLIYEVHTHGATPSYPRLRPCMPREPCPP